MALIRAVDLFFQFLYLMILARVFLSWVPAANNSSIARFIYQVTEPILEPFREIFSRFMPKGPGLYLDLSPIAALFVLEVARHFIMNILIRMTF